MPLEAVYDRLCDCEFVATNLHAAHKIEILSTERQGKGAKWIQHTQAEEDPCVSTHEIIQATPYNRVVMTSLDGLSTETFTFDLTPEGALTKLTFRNEIKGKNPFVRCTTALFGWVIRNMMKRDLQRFREAVSSLERHD